MYTYSCFALLYSRNLHNSAKRLYSNKVIRKDLLFSSKSVNGFSGSINGKKQNKTQQTKKKEKTKPACQ